MIPKRRRRSIQDRIADQERELQALRELERIENLEAAKAQGRVVDGKSTEFNAMLRDMRLMQKAALVARRYDDDALGASLTDFQDRLAEYMAKLVKEEESSE